MAAHFLHTICTFPEYWAFLRKMRTACFPLHKKSLVGVRPLYFAGARPFGHSKAPMGLLLLRKKWVNDGWEAKNMVLQYTPGVQGEKGSFGFYLGGVIFYLEKEV